MLMNAENRDVEFTQQQKTSPIVERKMALLLLLFGSFAKCLSRCCCHFKETIVWCCFCLCCFCCWVCCVYVVIFPLLFFLLFNGCFLLTSSFKPNRFTMMQKRFNWDLSQVFLRLHCITPTIFAINFFFLLFFTLHYLLWRAHWT